MVNFDALKAGDAVEVCRVIMLKDTEWLPAIIVDKQPDAIGVRYMRPNTDGDYIMLNRYDWGRTWR